MGGTAPEFSPATRWRARLSLRAVSALVFLVALALAWYARDVKVQRRCVAALLSEVAIVEYDGSPWPHCVTDYIDVDYYRSVVRVGAYKSRSDRVLAATARLRRLEELYLRGSWVTDAGLVHVKGLTSLRVLSLDGASVTDAGLVNLQGLTNLRYLFLRGSNVTDAGVCGLRRTLPQLKVER